MARVTAVSTTISSTTQFKQSQAAPTNHALHCGMMVIQAAEIFGRTNTGVDHCTGSGQNVCPSPDGLGDTPYFTGSSLAAVGIDLFPLMKPFAPLVSGTVLFETPTLTSESQGTYLTAVIGLPQGFNASNLIPSSISLNQTLVALRVTQVTQLSKAPILIAKFNMTQVKALLSNPGLYVLKISGNILTSKSFRPFEATSTIRLLPT